MVLLNQKILLLFREPPIMRAASVTDDLRLSLRRIYIRLCANRRCACLAIGTPNQRTVRWLL